MFRAPVKRRFHVLALIALTLLLALPGLSNLPVIDRDEARYAQASVQMAESGDWLNIRFQDEARNKKPAGVYWLQASAIKALNKDGERRIWVQRLPSVLGAVLAVLACYWGGLRMVGRRAAFMGAALLATSVIFVFEAHIAKTDAVLVGLTTVIFAALARLRHGGGTREVWAFWIALALSILVKGPIGIALAILTISGLWMWERHIAWARPLFNPAAIGLFLLLWVPWLIAMIIATDGAFLQDSLGTDFAGKLTSVQEKHPGPPGYHLALSSLTLWPAILFILPGLVYAVKAVKGQRLSDEPLPKAMRLALVWVVPFWILIELMPTKLPHYGLPLYPALCLMAAPALLAIGQIGGFAKSRFISGVLFVVAGAALITVVLMGQATYGPETGAVIAYSVAALAGLFVLIAAFAVWTVRVNVAFYAAIASAVILSGGTYQLLLPSLETLQTPERLALQLKAENISPERVRSPFFSEPSFVWHYGQNVNLGGDLDILDFDESPVILIDTKRAEAQALTDRLRDQATALGQCIEIGKTVEGYNYSRGDEVAIAAWSLTDCPPSDQSNRDAATNTAPVPE